MKNKIRFISFIIMGLLPIFINSCRKEDNAIKDIDGNVYTSVTIGKQTWMVENLKTTRYNDGISIPLVTQNSTWFDITSPGYCWYNDDELTNKSVYGALYNWYAVNTGKLCPSGWHVPTDAEWTELVTYLGGQNIAGGKLKESGITHWHDPNVGATNESGFSALPGGEAGTNGYWGLGTRGNWWSSTESNLRFLYRPIFNSDIIVFIGSSGSKNPGYSVRCLKD